MMSLTSFPHTSLPMDISIAIPSYQRPKTLQTHTLAFCERMGIHPQQIHVFLHSQDPHLHDYDYLQKLGVHVIHGPLGLHHMRNFITHHFPKGTLLLHMDDDIQGLYEMRVDLTIEDTKKHQRYPLFELTRQEFHHFLQKSFTLLHSNNAQLFGVYPVRNGYFMKGLPECSYNLRFCVGSFWGCINDHEIVLHIEEKEDVERTLLSFAKYNKVLRWNFLSPKTRYYHTSGGMQARNIDRTQASYTSSMYLLHRFPQFCSVYTGKKNGHTEVRLRSS